ncbi:MAG TPA: hypothetical protein VM597_17615 [Gemmataceae bacterium]|jgi:hypothetical protein|nr:hypothetical protein [Gemmataceae bacterium]
MSDESSRPPTAVALTHAARQIGATYARLRSLAVGRGEFTVVRDRVGVGVQYFLLRDEVSVFGAAGLVGLRRFRAREGRRWPGHLPPMPAAQTPVSPPADRRERNLP